MAIKNIAAILRNRSVYSITLSVLVSFLFVFAFATSTTTISSTGMLSDALTALAISITGTTTFNGIDYQWPNADGGTNQVLTTDGAGNLSWAPASSALFVGTTTLSYDGDISYLTFTGYKAANLICDSQYAGSHLCQTGEILNTIAADQISTFSGTAWIAEGPPGYTANSNDCTGYTTNSNTYLGAFWEMLSTNGGRGWLTNCAQTKPLACCS
jgi:hypothetical protein